MLKNQTISQYLQRENYLSQLEIENEEDYEDRAKRFIVLRKQKRRSLVDAQILKIDTEVDLTANLKNFKDSRDTEKEKARQKFYLKFAKGMPRLGVQYKYSWKKTKNDQVLPIHKIVSHMHESQPERASIIAQNLIHNKKEAKRQKSTSPYYNKKRREVNINYTSKELVDLGQKALQKSMIQSPEPSEYRRNGSSSEMTSRDSPRPSRMERLSLLPVKQQLPLASRRLSRNVLLKRELQSESELLVPSYDEKVNVSLPLTSSNRRHFTKRSSQIMLSLPPSLPEIEINEQVLNDEIQVPFHQESSEEDEERIPFELKVRREKRQNHSKPWKERPKKGPGTRLTGLQEILNYYRYKFPMYPQNSRVRQLKKSAYRMKSLSKDPILSTYESQPNLSSRKSIASTKRHSIRPPISSNYRLSRKESVYGRNTSQDSLIRIQDCYREDPQDFKENTLNYESSKFLQIAYEAPQNGLPSLDRNQPLLQNKFEKLLKRDFRRERKKESVVLQNMSEVLEEQKRMANEIILTAGVDEPLKLRKLGTDRNKPVGLTLPVIKRRPSPIYSRAISKVRSTNSNAPATSEKTVIVEEDEQTPENKKIREKRNSALNRKMEVWHDNFKAEVSYEDQFQDRQNYKFSHKLHSSL